MAGRKTVVKQESAAPQPMVPQQTVDNIVAEEKPKLVYANLPLISCLPTREKLEEAREYLELLEMLDEQADEIKIRTDRAKQKLAELQKEAGVQGLRLGALCFAQTEVKGRRTLSPVKLIEYGVAVAVIQACTVEGKPSVRNTFKNLDKPAKVRGQYGEEEDEG